MTAAQRSPATSDEAAAGRSIVLSLTLVVGAMAGLIGLVVADPVALVGAPAALVGGALLLGRPRVAAWFGLVLWLGLIPLAQGEAVVAPLVMGALCLAVAVGPGRLLEWLERETLASPGEHADGGWIEELDRRIG